MPERRRTLDISNEFLLGVYRNVDQECYAATYLVNWAYLAHKKVTNCNN